MQATASCQGVSVAEGRSWSLRIAGASPLFPRRLAYPELLGLTPGAAGRPAAPPRNAMETHFYDGTPGQLTRRLRDLAESLEANGTVWGATRAGHVSRAPPLRPSFIPPGKAA